MKETEDDTNEKIHNAHGLEKYCQNVHTTQGNLQIHTISIKKQ